LAVHGEDFKAIKYCWGVRRIDQTYGTEEKKKSEKPIAEGWEKTNNANPGIRNKMVPATKEGETRWNGDDPWGHACSKRNPNTPPRT